MGLILDNNALLAGDATQKYNALIGHNNILRAKEAVVTVTSEQAGGEKENCYSEGFTFDFWRPSSVATQQNITVQLPSSHSVNYIAFAAHDLFTVGAAAVRAQHSADGSAWTDSFTTSYTVTNDQPFVYVFATVSNIWHRIIFSSLVAIPSIGVISIGHTMKIPAPVAAPFTEPKFDRANRYVNERSEVGHIIGRTLISEGAAISVNARGIDRAWIEDIWEPNIRSIEMFPFFAVVHDDIVPTEQAFPGAFYGMTSAQPNFRYDNNVEGSIALRANGLVT